ncbi:MAG: helix-turn-helix transcriptional regulator [Gammaproteobacteria bacterium]|nr:helix-turn-helix transcriptional regulator [Gammaproteobacteria bacterium]
MDRDGRSVLAVNVRTARRLRGLTQEDLAALSGINRAYLSEIEHRKRNIGLDCLTQLARALRMPLADLLRESRP